MPTADDAQQAAVMAAARAVLDARARDAESALADLYDPLTMPPELSEAHETETVRDGQTWHTSCFPSICPLPWHSPHPDTSPWHDAAGGVFS